MSAAPETIEDHDDGRGLGCHLEPRWYPKAMLLQGPHQSQWPALPPGTMVTSRPRLLPRTLTRFMVLPQLGSILMTMAYVTTKGHIDTRGLGHNLCL